MLNIAYLRMLSADDLRQLAVFLPEAIVGQLISDSGKSKGKQEIMPIALWV
ncbi:MULTISPECIES: hypothetical protein [unclassified Sphingobium]|uniref:hypothetical protein n=1 Tax=unclassified Sphingobium TaxID=2611147 RepID=UPI0015E65309|nr:MULTISPECIES: hypothetical protein [unclassified Sphingobium]MBG6119778.1 hypothetical protein [Sphingobium sp. JAI105]